MNLERDVTLTAALTRIANSGVKANSIIKIGAGSGADTEYVEHFFPGARTLLIDMDDSFEHQWKRLSTGIEGLRYYVCAASNRDGDGFMRKDDRTGGVMTLERTPDARAIEHRRIDTLVEEHQMAGPYFVRFDTHGAEKLILAGAEDTLKHTSLIQMECYNFKHTPFWEMVPHLGALGFRLIDMCEPLFRQDGALWQMHLFFVREDHPAFKSNSYHAA